MLPTGPRCCGARRQLVIERRAAKLVVRCVAVRGCAAAHRRCLDLWPARGPRRQLLRLQGCGPLRLEAHELVGPLRRPLVVVVLVGVTLWLRVVGCDHCLLLAGLHARQRRSQHGLVCVQVAGIAEVCKAKGQQLAHEAHCQHSLKVATVGGQQLALQRLQLTPRAQRLCAQKAALRDALRRLAREHQRNAPVYESSTCAAWTPGWPAQKVRRPRTWLQRRCTLGSARSYCGSTRWCSLARSSWNTLQISHAGLASSPSDCIGWVGARQLGWLHTSISSVAG